MRKIIIQIRIITILDDGNIMCLGFKEKPQIFQEISSTESIIESIDGKFKSFGLDTTEIPKILEGVDDDTKALTITIKYRLEVDSSSILEFLNSEDGKNSELKLIKYN